MKLTISAFAMIFIGLFINDIGQIYRVLLPGSQDFLFSLWLRHLH